MSISVYGKFSESCDIVIVGFINGFELDDVVDNSFTTRKEAIDSIKQWAKKNNAQIEEICFS